MKPKLLLHPDKWSFAVAPHLEQLFNQHFDRVFIDSTATYHPKECLVYTHCIDTEWVIPWRDRGYKVVVDNSWEDHWPNLPNDVHIIDPQPWMCRANESILYKVLELDKYKRQPAITKTFLMLMNLKKYHRDLIWTKVDLADSIYSYQGRGIKLNYTDSTVGDWQRHFNPDWYNITNFSLVVESTIEPEPLGPTEKTWKPIAFHHPFLLWGPSGYLEILHQQGFQTFDHVIDETYDSEPDHLVRLQKILEQTTKLKNIMLTDQETIKRTKHNFELFYDTAWSEQQFHQNLFLPLLNLL